MATLCLVGKGGAKVMVKREVAEKCSVLITDMMDGQETPPDAPPTEIPIAVASGATLELLVQYMGLRWNNPPTKEIEKPLISNLNDILDEMDKNFLKPLNEAAVMELCVVANFLNCAFLRDLCCARLAEWVKQKSVEEIRAMFGIENDFSPEELEALRKEHGLERI